MLKSNRQVLLEDGSRLNPVVGFPTPTGCMAYFVLDEGCYVLYIENTAGVSTKSFWLFPEACKAMRRLPLPSKTKDKETELALRCRDLTCSEAGSKEYLEAASEVSRLLPKGPKEALTQIVEQGPVYDGDLVSKQARDTLASCGLVLRVAAKGSDGWNAANQLGYSVYKQSPV